MNKISQMLISVLIISAAGAAVWDFADNFSTIVNPSHNWSYGVIGGPNNSTGYANHPDSSFYSGFVYWWTNTPAQVETTARGFVIHNPNRSTSLNLTGATSVWGDSFVLRPNEAALTSSIYNIPDKQTIRWTAPADGDYNVSVTFSGISYAGTGTNCQVYIQRNGSTLYQSGISGFIGSEQFSIPPFGTKPSAAYSNTLTLSAGNTIDVFKNNTATATGNSVGVDITIFKAPDAPLFNVQLPLYVAPDGNDNNNGTIDSPLATIGRAKSIVEWLIYQGLTEDVNVYLRGGTYYLTEPLVFSSTDGDPAYSVIYQAYPGENPVISGGQRITGWTAIGNDKYTVTLPDVANGNWRFRQLWNNGRRCPRSRWPNPGSELAITNVSSDAKTVTVDQTVQGSDLSANGTEAVLISVWSMGRARCADKSGNTVTTIAVCGNPAGYPKPEAGQPFYLDNNPDYIDLDGEWHLHPSTGVLTYKSPAGVNPNDCYMIAPRLTELIKIDGMGTPVKNIRFKGLSFKHTTWDYPTDQGYGGFGGGIWNNGINGYGLSVGAAILCRWAQDCSFERCRFTNLGTTAIAFGKGCNDGSVLDCAFSDLGCNAVTNGYNADDNYISEAWQPSFVPANQNITNNYIEQTGQDWLGGIGVFDWLCSDTTIANNIICKTSYTGVASVRSPMSENQIEQGPCLIMRNHLYDIKYPLHDGAALYANQDQQGTQMVGNLIHDVHYGINPAYDAWPHSGIYWDNGCSNIYAGDNITYNIAHWDFHENTVDANVGRTYGTNYLNANPNTWGTVEQTIADAAGINPASPVLSVVLNDTNDGYLLTASCQAWINIEDAVIEETGTDITDLFTLMENGQVSATIDASLLNTTSTATIKLTISDPDGHLAVGVWSMRNRWDVAEDFSGTGGNPTAQWSYGYKTSNGAFTLLPDFGGHYYMNMSGWFINNNWQAVCMANEDDQPHEAEFWGSNYYAQPNSAYLAQTNLFGQNVVYRWTAPADGIYYLETEFAGAIYSGGETNSNVSVVVNNTNTAFNDYVQGFAGGGTHTANGVKPAASCEGTLSLAAGDTVDFIQTDRNSAGNDITRLSAWLTLLGPVASYNKGDFNFDGVVGNEDIYTLALHWLEAYSPTYYLQPVGDITNDKIVDLNDFAVIAEKWLK